MNVAKLNGLGAVGVKVLNEANITTIGQLAELDDLKCAMLQGKYSRVRLLRTSARMAIADPKNIKKYVA